MVNTTTVENKIDVENQVNTDVQVDAVFNPTFANAVSVDTSPLAAPIERMGDAVSASMEASLTLAKDSAIAQAAGMAAVATGLSALGLGIAKREDEAVKPLAELAGKFEGVTKIAAAVLTLAAVYFLFAKGRLPDIEVSA